MIAIKIYIGTIVAFLGLGILLSYYPIVKTQGKPHDYWVGMPRNTRILLHVFQILAAIGFLVYVGDLLFGRKQLPKKGIFKNQYALPILITGILVFSLAWSFLVVHYFKTGNLKIMVVLSLVLTAICSILLLAGEFENEGKWYTVLSLIVFNVVTVLCDAIGWNSKFILNRRI